MTARKKNVRVFACLDHHIVLAQARRCASCGGIVDSTVPA